MNKIIVTLVLILIIATGCSKKVNGTFTIKGHLYKDCGMQPLTNRYVSLYQSEYGDETSFFVHQMVSGFTDSTGYFELKYNSQYGGNVFIQNYLFDIPKEKNIDNLIIYLLPRRVYFSADVSFSLEHLFS